MKSPFKFLDSYTKDDRDIFFGCNTTFFTIPPLQGLIDIVYACSIGRRPMLKVYCAYSASLKLRFALKGQYMLKQDTVLFAEPKNNF
jgi:hypothetical protein